MNTANSAPSGEPTSHRNVYQIVTEQIIRQLEHGVAPWRKPWRTELPVNLVSGKPYRGLNVFLLGSQGYGSRSGMPNPPRREQSSRAWYRPSTDTVGMPSRSLFSSLEEHYSTLFHELTHSTGHSSRLGREGIEQLNTFGSESYSKEELVAEMGAAMLCGLTGLAPKTLENSAAYLQTWLGVLKSDSRMVVTAASAAQKAVDYIVGKSQGNDQGDGEGCQ